VQNLTAAATKLTELQQMSKHSIAQRSLQEQDRFLPSVNVHAVFRSSHAPRPPAWPVYVLCARVHRPTVSSQSAAYR
jgi:hypothetical protein